MVSASDLVIKNKDPRRERMVWVMLSASIVIIAALAYFFGQRTGEYFALETRSEIKQLSEENDSLKRSNQKLRQQIADVETAQTIDASSYAALKTTVKELENKLSMQGKELRFYRQILAPEDKVEGLHLLDPAVKVLPNSQGFQLDMVVYQFNRLIREIYGDVRLNVTGTLNGAAQTYNLNNLLTENSGQAIKFKFRYFQSYELRFVLPEGFVPSSLQLIVSSPIPGYKIVDETIAWSKLLGHSTPQVGSLTES